MFGLDLVGGAIDFFVGLIEGLFVAMINGMLSLIDDLLVDILALALRVEDVRFSVSHMLSAQQFEATYWFIYSVAIGLMGLKFIFRGFEVYILWRDGDADNSPADMLMGVGQAMFVMFSFPLLYEYMADITIYVAEGVINNLGTTAGISVTTPVDGVLIVAGAGLINAIIMLIFLIMVFVLWMKMLRRGIELLIMRLCVPLACIGLIDSDMGAFKSYMQALVSALLATILQVVLMSLALRLTTSYDPVSSCMGIATILVAFSGPDLIQKFMPQSRSGGMTSKIHTASMLAGGVRKLAGK